MQTYFKLKLLLFLMKHWTTKVLFQITKKCFIDFSPLKRFNLSQTYFVDRPIHQCEYIPFAPPSLNDVYGSKNQTFLVLPREVSATSLNDIYFEKCFNVTQGAAGRYADEDQIGSVNTGHVF